MNLLNRDGPLSEIAEEHSNLQTVVQSCFPDDAAFRQMAVVVLQLQISLNGQRPMLPLCIVQEAIDHLGVLESPAGEVGQPMVFSLVEFQTRLKKARYVFWGYFFRSGVDVSKIFEEVSCHFDIFSE